MSNISASTDVSMLPESCQCHVVPGSGRHNPDPPHTVVGGDDATAAVVVVCGTDVVVTPAVVGGATGTVDVVEGVVVEPGAIVVEVCATVVVDARATGIGAGKFEDLLAA
jgi:hypothetical protein